MSPQPEPADPVQPRYLRLVRALGPHVVEICLSSLLINGCGLLMPVFSMLVYDKVVGNGNNETLWALATGMLLVLLLEFCLRLIRGYSVERLAAIADIRMDARMFDRLLEANPARTAGAGVLMSRYRDSTGARDALFSQYAVLAADLPFLLLFLGALAFMGGPLVLVAVVSAVPLLAGQWLLYRPQRDYGVLGQTATAGKTGLLAMLVGGLPYFQTTPLRHTLADRWETQASEAALLRGRQRYWQTLAQSWAGLCIGLASVALLVAGVYRIEAGAMSVGALIACSLVQLRAMVQISSVAALTTCWRDLSRTQAELDAAAQPEKAPADPPPVQGITLPATDALEITVQHLACHDDAGAAVLDDLSLLVQRGERVAVVGRPGSGKSTLLRCMAGVQTPDAGMVLVEGTRIGAVPADARAQWLAYKPQDPVLIGPALQDDLPAENGEHAAAAVSALELTGLLDALRSGELRRDQAVTAGGYGLSGGQRQMIALARALASPAAVVLLDEPTVGVDAQTEQRLAEAVKRLTQGKTVVMATHSTALLGFVDRIVVLERGRIVAAGPRDQILKPPAQP
ncbi:ATP-binding cassette domain-containing protein [Hydrogenophaga sp.]|uniref:ATP-binding cassette domain-containing protein n=1 Tax=Hydrogenophaga sp. TaxID=1904254 RepID=UPI00263700B5|nr:ATP-binding cassette domain-containing protein [Hydrogenophaga sp.]MCW5655263.1 ATP-binding cassette domain-containing protein [Hydrogenophaga sp.]